MAKAGLIHHIELNVSELSRSIEFWGWLLEYLGYSSFQEWEGGKSWKLDETYIVLVQTVDAHLDVKYHRRKTGLNHLAFYAKSKDEVNWMVKIMEEKGIPLLYQEQFPYAGGTENYAIFCEDPDRIKVEIIAEEEVIE